MTSRSLNRMVAAAALAAGALAAAAVSQDQAGPGPAMTPTPPAAGAGDAFKDNPQAIEAGKALYMANNCVGCHFMGAGGIGPAFLDTTWVYGGEIDQIYTSIRYGRPNGMPSWDGFLTDEEMWQLAAFVSTLPSMEPLPTEPPAATVASAESLKPKTLKVIKAE